MNWRPATQLPQNITHALCWAKWPDGNEFFRRGIYCEEYHGTKWQLDWDGSFSNDDATVLYWLPLEELGITYTITPDGNSSYWQLNPNPEERAPTAG